MTSPVTWKVLVPLFFGAVAVLPGCTWSASPPIEPGGPRVALMPESDFAAFADRIAQRIPEAFSAPGTGLPPALSLPSVSVERLNEQSAANDFARTLVAGLNDRLGGRTRFEQTVESGRGPRSSLLFTDAEGGTNPDVRVATFSIAASGGDTELLRESAEFEPLTDRPPVAAPPPQPPRTAARPTQPRELPPPKQPEPELPERIVAPTPEAPADEAPNEAPRPARTRKIKLSLRGPEFIDAIAGRLPQYDAWTRRGAGGEIIFLDADSFERFWVQRIRTSRTVEDQLKVEFDVRARGKTRDADYRFVFYDADGCALSSTPKIDTEFDGYRVGTVSITASDERAQKWVCLFEED